MRCPKYTKHKIKVNKLPDTEEFRDHVTKKFYVKDNDLLYRSNGVLKDYPVGLVKTRHRTRGVSIFSKWYTIDQIINFLVS